MIFHVDCKFTFDIGSPVVHTLHKSEHKGNIGIVTSREYFEDAGGGGLWYGVRWMDPHGKLSESNIRMSGRELRDAS